MLLFFALSAYQLLKKQYRLVINSIISNFALRKPRPVFKTIKKL